MHVFAVEMAMGWVHPWVGLGWVGSDFFVECDRLGWVRFGSNMKVES